MKQPELFMSADWPDPDTRTTVLARLQAAPMLTFYWPVAYLPESMGWLPSAEKLEGEPSGQYFLKTRTTFFEDELVIYGRRRDQGGPYPDTNITYDELAHLIAQADTTLRRASDPPPSLQVYLEHSYYDQADVLQTRRYAGRLRVVDAAEGPEEIPF